MKLLQCLILPMLLAWNCGVYGTAPVVRIPAISTAAGTTVRESAEFDPAQWSEAASINSFAALGNVPIRYETTFLLQHDGTNLYVAAIAENPAGRAFPRAPEEVPVLDETVQVVLGTAAKFATRLSMGGYEGAFSEQEPVAHFYEFSVNRAGARSRTYNETPLPNPHFDARVTVETSRWITCFVIPFAAIGIPEVTGETGLYFNAFRFHDAVRYGWHLPAFGGYSALPFGFATLLTDGVGHTVASAWVPPVPQASAEEQHRTADYDTLEIKYYHLLRMLAVKLPPDNSGRTLVLRRIGGDAVEQTLNSLRPGALKLPLPRELAPETPFAAELLLREVDGTLTLLTTYQGKVSAPPEWLDSQVAAEYLDRVVPRPWTALEWRDPVLKLAHGEFEFADGVLPSQVTVRGRKLLRAPMRLIAVAGGRELAVNPRVRAEASGARLELASGAAPGVELKSMVDFDGFTSVRLRLAGVEPKAVERLELRIPLARGVAEYLIRGNTQTFDRVGEFGFSGNAGGGEFWFGGMNAGINFCFDRSPFRSEADGRQVELTVDDNGDSELIFRFVTAAGQLVDADTVLPFFWQPTPVRPESVRAQKNEMEWLFEAWSDYQSYPDLNQLPKIKAAVEREHAAGKRLYLYFGQTVAENSPYYKDFPDELYAPNRTMYYERAYEPGKGVRCYLSCMRSPACELLLDGVAKIADQAGIDGVYLDGPTVPFHCDNPLHRCDDLDAAQWDEDWHAGRIAGQRAFVKRLRGIFDRRGKDDPLWAHTGNSINLATLGLSDFYLEGEALARYRRGYLLEPERYAICFSGKPFGFRGLFLPVLYIDATLSTRQAMAWAFPHGSEMGIGVHPVEQAFYGVLKRDPAAQFYGYWMEQPHVKRLAGDVILGYYRGEHEAVIAVGNVKYVGMQQTRIDLSEMFPGLAVKVTPLYTPNDSVWDGKTLSFPVPEEEFRLFHVIPAQLADQVELPEPASKFVAAKTREFSPPAPLELQADNDEWQMATWAEGMSENFTVKMTVNHQADWRLELDGVQISCDSAGGWLITGLNEFAQGEDCDVTLANYGRTYMRPDQPVELIVAVNQGRISVIYDGVLILRDGYPQEIWEAHTLRFGVKGAGHRLLVTEGSLTDMKLPEKLHPVR